jgi:hypothetical protein
MPCAVLSGMEIEIRARLTNGRARFKAGRPVKAYDAPQTC